MSFAAASVTLSVAGMASSAIGSYYSAKSQKASLEHQAQMAEINARLAEKAAQHSLIQGERGQEQVRLRGARVKSAQKVAMAANGIDLGSDTAVNNLTETDVMTEMDANTVEANALQSAWGHRMQATNMQGESSIKRATADGISPGWAAAGSLLSSSGSVASSWYSMKKQGW